MIKMSGSSSPSPILTPETPNEMNHMDPSSLMTLADSRQTVSVGETVELLIEEQDPVLFPQQQNTDRTLVSRDDDHRMLPDHEKKTVKIHQGELNYIGEFTLEPPSVKAENTLNPELIKSEILNKLELRFFYGISLKYLVDLFETLNKSETKCFCWIALKEQIPSPLSVSKVKQEEMESRRSQTTSTTQSSSNHSNTTTRNHLYNMGKFKQMLSKDQKCAIIQENSSTLILVTGDLFHLIGRMDHKSSVMKGLPLYLCYIDHVHLPPYIKFEKPLNYEDLKSKSKQTIIDAPILYHPQFATGFFDLDRPSITAQFSGKRVVVFTDVNSYTGGWLLETLKSSGAIFVKEFEPYQVDIVMIHRRLSSQIPFIPNLNRLKNANTQFLIFGDRLYLPLHRTKIDPVFHAGGIITLTKEFCLTEGALWNVDCILNMIQRLRNRGLNWLIVLSEFVIKELGRIYKEESMKSTESPLASRIQKILFLFNKNCTTAGSCRMMTEDEHFFDSHYFTESIHEIVDPLSHPSPSSSLSSSATIMPTTSSTFPAITHPPNTVMQDVSNENQKRDIHKHLAMSMIRIQFKWMTHFRHFLVVYPEHVQLDSMTSTDVSIKLENTVVSPSPFSFDPSLMGGIEFVHMKQVIELWKRQS